MELCVILSIALLALARGTVAEQINDCGLLETTNYHLDFTCINQQKARSVTHRFKGFGKEECKKACCEWSEGPCDMVYWDRSQLCLIMNFYVIAICPLLTTAISHASSYDSGQYVMLRVTTDINFELKRHLKGNYQSQIKQILNCKPTDVLCSDWNCIDQQKDCNGISDCSDGSDEVCMKGNNTNLAMHCIDKDGVIVYPGTFFVKSKLSDPCEKCRCLTDGSSICYNIQCAVICPNGKKKGACCECTDDTYINMSSTQRLVVSCMSVLAVVSMLLFFSRNILQRRNSRHNVNIINWLNRREEQYNAAMRNNRDSAAISDNSDLPPPYILIKPTEENDDSVPPPSYNQIMEENQSHNANTETEQVLAGTSEVAPNNAENSTTNRNSTNENISHDDGGSPQSPLSVTSESPLIEENSSVA